jgi:hypothetical protein
MTFNIEEQIAVIWMGGEWRIIRNGIAGAHFDYQIDATEAADRLARDASAKGRATELLVQDRFGELETVTIVEQAKNGRSCG